MFIAVFLILIFWGCISLIMVLFSATCGDFSHAKNAVESTSTPVLDD